MHEERNSMAQQIEMVIFDWAGTTVDYGSSAPVHVFDKTFRKEGIVLTKEQINEPMGMEKKAHIRQLLTMEEVDKEWKSLKEGSWTEEDVQRLYENFEATLAEIVAEYSTPIKGVVETVNQLRTMGLKIGSTTGYTSEMMENVIEGASKAGYSPDCIITPDIAGGSRPTPFMIYEAMKQLDVHSPKTVVKVGDTISDIKEGKNANSWSVGLLEGSNLLGLTEEEYNDMDPDRLQELKDQTAKKYYASGADFVIDSIKELPELINRIDNKYGETNEQAISQLNRFYNPVATYQGPNALEQLPEVLETIPIHQRLLMITWNESVLDLEIFKQLAQDKEFDVAQTVFTETNPTVDDLLHLTNQTKKFKPDVIIAVGGGSVMDIGKSLCMMYEHSIETIDDIRDIIDEKKDIQPSTKWVGIPTTAGTGSEVTKWATIWDPKIDKKRSVTSSMNYAYAAIIDPKLSESVPLASAMSSALDAVAHAAESYWSRKTNVITRSLALTAISKVMNNIDSLIEGTGGMNELTQGSNIAGLAFSNTQTTACHAISYPLTMRYKIPHGTAVSLLIAPVMKLNEETILEKDVLFEALGVKSTDELRLRIHDLLERASIPTRLRDYGIEKTELERIAALAHTKGISENNPVSVDEKVIFDILDSIY